MLLGNAEIGKGREMRGKDRGHILNIKYCDENIEVFND